MDQRALVNPELEGGPFIWRAGQVGVVLVHGFTATAAEVRPLAERLHGTGLTVAGPLLPGHGTTPDDLNRVKWRSWVDAAEACYRELDACCDRVVVGGESMGALVALVLASEHPDVCGILTYAPAFRVAMRPIDRLLLYLAAPFVPWMVKGRLGDSPLWQGYRVDPLKGALELMRLQREVRRRLPGVKQPILIVQGGLDKTIDPQSGALIQQRIGSRYQEMHWMHESGHCVLLDSELEEITTLTLSFVERAAQGTARDPVLTAVR